MLSPGYSYDKAPDQQHFLGRAQNPRAVHARSSATARRTGASTSRPLFLEFLMGKRHYTCTPWGMPTYNIFGWQKPCYLLQDGYADTFQELIDTTGWDSYGTESGNPKCANCMVHSGYEATAPSITPSDPLGGLFATAKAVLFGANTPIPSADRPWRDDGTETRTAPLVPLEAYEWRKTRVARDRPRW